MSRVPYIEIPWKIKAAQAPKAAIVLKSLCFSRWDLEEIYVDGEGEDRVRYNSKNKVLATFDVFPDFECFQRRILPMSNFNLSWITGSNNVGSVEDFIDPDYLYEMVLASDFPGDIVGSEVDLKKGKYLYGEE